MQLKYVGVDAYSMMRLLTLMVLWIAQHFILAQVKAGY